MKPLLPIFLTLLMAVLTGCRTHDLATERGQARFGVEAAQMDLWREARFRFERAVAMNSDDARNWSNLAVAYEGTGEYDLARDAYLRALQLDRANQFVQRNYSRFLEHYGTPDQKEPEGEVPEENSGVEVLEEESDDEVPEDETAVEEPPDPDVDDPETPDGESEDAK